MWLYIRRQLRRQKDVIFFRRVTNIHQNSPFFIRSVHGVVCVRSAILRILPFVVILLLADVILRTFSSADVSSLSLANDLRFVRVFIGTYLNNVYEKTIKFQGSYLKSKEEQKGESG